MKLAKTLAGLLHETECTIIGNQEEEIAHLTNDSREVNPGSLFFAITGYKDDGRRYISHALAKGMTALVSSLPQPDCPVTQVIVPNVRAAQASIARNFYDNPGKNLTIIGITGTNGKSTSTFMVDSILRAQGYKTGLMGTLYNKIGPQIFPTRHTTPDSIHCQQLLQQMVMQQVSHVSMEVSSHAMIMERVAGIPFAAGALTNFSLDHLDIHKDMEDYLRAKKKFFDSLPSSAIVAVNADEKHSPKLIQDCQASLITYAMNEVADVMATRVEPRDTGTFLEIAITRPLTLPGGHILRAGELETVLHIPGRHNIYNALLASAITLGLGLEHSAVAAGISRFKGLFRRCEQIWQGKYTVIDDATHNPGNMNALFETVTARHRGKLVVVFGIRGSRGHDINRELAGVLGAWSKRAPIRKIIVTNCADTAKDSDQVLPEEAAAFQEELLQSASCKAEFTDTLRDAVAQAVNTVHQGETLLLLGAHPMDEVSEIFAQEANIQLKTLPRPPAFGS